MITSVRVMGLYIMISGVKIATPFSYFESARALYDRYSTVLSPLNMPLASIAHCVYAIAEREERLDLGLKYGDKFLRAYR